MSEHVVGFLDLPREIRDQCYSYLRGKPGTAGSGFAFKFPLSVLVLNRQIMEEARRVLYQSNPFTMLIKEDFNCRNRLIRKSLGEKSEVFVVVLKHSAIRPCIKDFVLSMHFDYGVDSASQYLEPYVPKNVMLPLTTAIFMMSQGPLVRSLTLHLHFTRRRRYEGPSTISLHDAFSPLNGRVHELTLHCHDDIGRLLQLELLHERLHYRPAKKASFLDIPLELRQRCYSYMVADMNQGVRPTVRIIGSLAHLRGGVAKWKFAASLLRTCHQVHNEASAFFYSKITVPLNLPVHHCCSGPKNYSMSSYGSLVTHYDITLVKGVFLNSSRVELLCKELRMGPKIETLRIRALINPFTVQEQPDAYEFIDGFHILSDHVEEVIIGPLTGPHTEDPDCWGPDETCYRRLRSVLQGVTKWTFPMPDYQFAEA